MYCRTELHGPTAALKGHLYPYLNNIRNIFTFQPPLSEAKGIARSLLAFILSIAFIGIGMTFVIRGLNEGGYFNWTIGALLLFYGGAALRNAWIAFFRK